VQILHLLGNEGPKTPDPSKYIRYVYNRVILENATVRASAVSALAKFGAVVENLRPRILILLRRCLYDNDDEVLDPPFSLPFIKYLVNSMYPRQLMI
jgi:coatomer protein complex subunit gamma